MRVLLKANNYLTLLTHHNIYLKSGYSTKINTALPPPPLTDLLALQNYLPPIKPL